MDNCSATLSDMCSSCLLFMVVPFILIQMDPQPKMVGFGLSDSSKYGNLARAIHCELLPPIFFMRSGAPDDTSMVSVNKSIIPSLHPSCTSLSGVQVRVLGLQPLGSSIPAGKGSHL
jgi:hypothetical protein